MDGHWKWFTHDLVVLFLVPLFVSDQSLECSAHELPCRSYFLPLEIKSARQTGFCFSQVGLVGLLIFYNTSDSMVEALRIRSIGCCLYDVLKL